MQCQWSQGCQMRCGILQRPNRCSEYLILEYLWLLCHQQPLQTERSDQYQNRWTDQWIWRNRLCDIYCEIQDLNHWLQQSLLGIRTSLWNIEELLLEECSYPKHLGHIQTNESFEPVLKHSLDDSGIQHFLSQRNVRIDHFW